MHRIGGLEKEDITGNVSYDPENHQHMTNVRAQKVENAAKLIGEQSVQGPDSGELLVVSWGGTYGACATAVQQCQNEGMSIAHTHLRWLNPFPANLEAILKNYKTVLVPELNTGQLRMLLRSRYGVDAVGYNKVKGKPFGVAELLDVFKQHV
jgi:2-oxoglutarate ferredoxin oxidoreductase subunit alpha